MIVEILSFAGCPNDVPARATVERLLGELSLEAEIREIEVPDLEAAKRFRFLGSPTIRVDGRDVEPGADERREFTLACRLFHTEQGYHGQPDERWIRAALLEGAGR
ncbi:MAG: DF family (seleno)protein [Gaiellaceae bacterium]